MPTDSEIMEQALAEGKTLVEALAAVEAPSLAPDQPVADGSQPSPPIPTSDDLSPYLETIPESLRELVRPSLRTMLDDVKDKSASASEAEAQLAAMNKTFAQNPKGALAFLAEHYRIPVRFDGDPAGAAPQPSPQRQEPQIPTIDAEIDSLKSRIGQANNMGEVAELVDRLTTLKATRIVGESVAPVAAAQLSQEEQRQMDRLRSENPDIPIDTLMPQIKRRQATLRERPYLTPEEGMYIELGPALVQHVRRLKTQIARASTPAERAATGVAGPGGAAPAIAGFDVQNLTTDQLMALMKATGGVAPDR